MTPDECGELLAALAAAFPPVSMAEETLQIYERFLLDIPFEEATLAVATWISTQARFPRISELRASVRREQGDHAPDPDQAWTEVRLQVAKVGVYREPSFSHPAIAQAVLAIGWREICASTEPGVERAHFFRAYDSTVRRHQVVTHSSLAREIAGEVRERLTVRRKHEINAHGAPVRSLPERTRSNRSGGDT